MSPCLAAGVRRARSSVATWVSSQYIVAKTAIAYSPVQAQNTLA
jgi:hypothetical protein